MALSNLGLITFLTTTAIAPWSSEVRNLTMPISAAHSSRMEKIMRMTPTVTSLRFQDWKR